MLYILVWLDDILIVSSSPVRTVNENLSRNFNKKDFGKIRQFRGLRITQGELGISVERENFIVNTLAKLGMECCNRNRTQTEVNVLLVKVSERDSEIDGTAYRNLARSLLHLSKETTPDVLCITNNLSGCLQHLRRKDCTGRKRC